MAKARYEGPPRALEQYEALVERFAEVDRKGAKNPYTSRNGHMFSYLGPDGTMALRLSPDDLETFLATYQTERPVSYGAVMKEYAEVPARLLAAPDDLEAWFAKSHDWIGTLKPKPTKKPAKKKPTKKAAKKAAKPKGA